MTVIMKPRCNGRMLITISLISTSNIRRTHKGFFVVTPLSNVTPNDSWAISSYRLWTVFTTLALNDRKKQRFANLPQDSLE